MTDRRQRRGAAVRDALLDVASDLFRESGASAVGVDEIVARSGIAKSTLYRWFPTKDDLIIAFLRHRDELFWEQWDRTAARHGADPGSELEAQLQWLAEYIASPDFRGCPFLNTTAEFADAGHAVRAVCRAHKQELRARLLALCERLEVDDAASLADQLALAIDGAFSVSQVYGAGGPHGQLVATGRTLIAAARPTP
jgi:AcrR family transcriptional regulator